MAAGHIVLTTSSPQRLELALLGHIYTPMGDDLFDPKTQRHCPGPPHPNLLTLIVEANGCAESYCRACDEAVCPACDVSVTYCLDTGTTICENCDGKSIWHSLAELAAETEPRLTEVVYGCYGCGGEETPLRTATIMHRDADNTPRMHWLCRSCVHRHGPEKALSQLTHADRHPNAQTSFNGTSPTRLVPSITQGLPDHPPLPVGM